jgi:hypothetical protein
MAKNNQPFEDLSETAERTVEMQKKTVEQMEKTVDQNMQKARGAMDNYFSFLQKIWGSNDLTEKMKTYTEKNISAYAECVGKLGQAKNFQEVFRIQTEFMQTQLNSFTEQARSLGEAYDKAGTEATEPFRMVST